MKFSEYYEKEGKPRNENMKNITLTTVLLIPCLMASFWFLGDKWRSHEAAVTAERQSDAAEAQAQAESDFAQCVLFSLDLKGEAFPSVPYVGIEYEASPDIYTGFVPPNASDTYNAAVSCFGQPDGDPPFGIYGGQGQ